MQRIPEEFVRRCCKNMLNPVYLEVPSGQVWEVEVQHSEGQIWLAKGWEDFCDYYSISCGHFLMFGYNAHSHFDVTIFDLSATEIEYPYSLRTFHCHETQHVLKSDLSESDDYVDILEDIPRSQKLNEKVPDMVDHSVENLGDGQSSKRKRDEEDVASPSFTRKGQCEDLIGYDLNSMIHQQQSIYDQNKMVMDKESTIAYQKAKAFKSKNPFIISFMQASYVSTPFSMKFARKHFLENNGNLLLRFPGSGSWDDKIFVDVIIFRAAGSTPMHNIVGKVPGGSDSKSKVVKADNSVPCSQPKIKLNFLYKIVWKEHGEGTEIKHSAEILGHCPLGRGIKRKRPEVDAEDDAVENSQEDVALPSPTKNTKKSGGSCGMHKQQSKIVYNKNKTVMVKDSTIAYQRAKAFKSKNPFIISFMQPSYVSIPYILKIHSKFARKYFLETDGNLMLRIPGCGSWSVKCTIRTRNAKVYSGWKTFMLENKLKVGAVCVFEVIKGAQLCVDVTIFRAAGSTLMHDIVAEVPGGSDSKRKVINHHMCLWSEARCNWNSSPNNPKFIQIITSSDELCRLRIPVVFAKRHCKNMLNPVFVEAPHGKAWEVEVENSQGQIWLAKGWKDFCGYYSISVRSLLVFTYNPRSHFDVAIYDQSTTEIEYPIDQEIESDEEEEDIPVLQANANVIEEEEEDIPVNLQANANVIEEEEEDIPVNLQANANVIEEEEEDIPVNLQTNANVFEQEISEGYEEHDQQPNIGTGKTNRSIILLQAKQSSKKSTEAEVIPNRNSEAAAAIGTTDTDTDVSYEESDDESKNM
ncbi:hypothetical protein KY290_013959 [Solanum tuberosum]|uniref:TF-B3 domain-containing protein n=1 Tax=Solanum tuberosum TaxID=4113 RepID=A0ABQ7VQ45_SOLTU|nr:hypothetical protein KY290_013959 [Solanum tuberosum]